MLVHTSAIVCVIGEPGVWGDPYLAVLRTYSQLCAQSSHLAELGELF